MTDNNKKSNEAKTSTLEINEFYYSQIPIVNDGETWVSIAKGLNILAASAGTNIAKDGYSFEDCDNYGVALEFIRELNEKLLDLIRP